jgi:putative Ca2+/H+ antiporter (TMEM165/GDT1 family)
MSQLLTAIVVVFVAELGDKTQLVAVGVGARYRLAPVLAGVALGYVASVTLSVVIGSLLGAALPTRAIGIVGGVLFIGFAVWTLRSALRGDVDPVRPSDAGAPVSPFEEGSDQAAAETTGSVRVAVTVATLMFVAELGDKTMLATATLAAGGSPLGVWIGATIGIIAAGFVGVALGRVLGDRLPERAIAFGSSALFAVFGFGLIVSAV